jgi:hypothetical protein
MICSVGRSQAEEGTSGDLGTTAMGPKRIIEGYRVKCSRDISLSGCVAGLGSGTAEGGEKCAVVTCAMLVCRTPVPCASGQGELEDVSARVVGR